MERDLRIAGMKMTIPAKFRQFNSDPEKFLDQFNLTGPERGTILNASPRTPANINKAIATFLGDVPPKKGK